MKPLIAALVLMPLVGAGSANAQQAERYQLQKTEKGYVRMDTQTGAMSICEQRDDQLVCRMAADERAAMAASDAGLEDRLRRLEERIAALEARQPHQMKPQETEQEFEQGLDRMERFFRRFMGVVKDFETTPEAPDRT